MADFEITIVGAGVVGLAVAARLAPRHPNLLIVERRSRHGMETSSRNSEVIHAGMYYPPGSLKAVLCSEGNRQLYDLAARQGIPCRRLTKLVVATSAGQTTDLERLFENGRANSVELRLLTRAESLALEPNVAAVAALYSPATGILSVEALMTALLASAQASGATLLTDAEVVGIGRQTPGYEVALRRETGPETFTTERLVNAAGLVSDEVAALAGIDVEAAGYRLHYWKGSYFAASSRLSGVVSRLVYPVPGQTSLGVHVVLDLAGRLRFGPDVEYLPDRRIDYAVDPGKRGAFASAARALLPGIEDDDLAPDTSGVRPKLQAPGAGPRDFVIAEESARGLPGLVDLVGIDSPGLTACLAIADRVARLVG